MANEYYDWTTKKEKLKLHLKNQLMENKEIDLDYFISERMWNTGFGRNRVYAVIENAQEVGLCCIDSSRRIIISKIFGSKINKKHDADIFLEDNVDDDEKFKRDNVLKAFDTLRREIQEEKDNEKKREKKE